MKKCTKCGIEKDENCFYKNHETKGGLDPSCKECRLARMRAIKASRDNEAKEREKARTKAYGQSIRGKYKIYKASAKKRDLPFDLTQDQFSSFWQANCSYCGDQIATVGLDRIDSSKGYTIDNCRACCWECNRVKGDRDTEALNTHLLKMLKFQGIV